MPKPPTCISKINIVLPQSVKSPTVDFTIKPFTHAADVAVKSASINEMPFSPTVLIFTISKSVPPKIRNTKLSKILRAGFAVKRSK